MAKDKPVIFFEDGILMTTSLEVARIFEKSHYSILRAIRNRDIPEDFSGHNFVFVEIIDKTKSGMLLNKSYFKMTRDGFDLIAMGFTGKRAMLHKIDFIYAFNAVVDELNRMKEEKWRRLDGPVPRPQIEAPPESYVEGWRYLCGHCKQWLPPSMFNLDCRRNPPRQSWCREGHKKAVSGKAWRRPTSSEVARIFGKQHYHIMRDIREMKIPEDFRLSIFGLIEIIEENASNLMITKSDFKITRDAIKILMVGNTRGLQFLGYTPGPGANLFATGSSECRNYRTRSILYGGDHVCCFCPLEKY